MLRTTKYIFLERGEAQGISNGCWDEWSKDVFSRRTRQQAHSSQRSWAKYCRCNIRFRAVQTQHDKFWIMQLNNDKVESSEGRFTTINVQPFAQHELGETQNHDTQQLQLNNDIRSRRDTCQVDRSIKSFGTWQLKSIHRWMTHHLMTNCLNTLHSKSMFRWLVWSCLTRNFSCTMQRIMKIKSVG